MTTNEMEQTVMYSQLQPWSQAGAPPCMEEVVGPTIPTRIGNYYKTSRPHPWRPTLGYEPIQFRPLHDQPITNQLLNTCFTPRGMSTEPLTFPNLVTGFNRNPQHAARAALYTRYTIDEWDNSCKSIYSESDKNRNYSEKLRTNIELCVKDRDDKTVDEQRGSGKSIGERITDITFWKNELSGELEKLIIESDRMAAIHRNILKAEQDLEIPLHIAQECLYHRERRNGVEKTHDIVEKSLLLEINNLREAQEKLKNLRKSISEQLAKCRATQYALEEDVVHKESAIGIDSVCHSINNFTRGINYYGGIENYDSTQSSSAELWSKATGNRIQKSQLEREKSTQIRTDAEALINNIAVSVWDNWSVTNNALNQRASELLNAKNNVQIHLQRIQNEIFTLQDHIELLKKAIQDKSNPLKVAHTRLEARSHRSGYENCKDQAQLGLITEVKGLQTSVTILHDQLQNAEAQQQQLLKTRTNLETNLKNKADALFIDREKCMGLRRSFPVNIIIKY